MPSNLCYATEICSLNKAHVSSLDFAAGSRFSDIFCVESRETMDSVCRVLATCDNSGLSSRQLEPCPDLLAFFTKSNSTLSKPAKLRRSFLEIRTDLQYVEVPRSY